MRSSPQCNLLFLCTSSGSVWKQDFQGVLKTVEQGNNLYQEIRSYRIVLKKIKSLTSGVIKTYRCVMQTLKFAEKLILLLNHFDNWGSSMCDCVSSWWSLRSDFHFWQLLLILITLHADILFMCKNLCNLMAKCRLKTGNVYLLVWCLK